MDRGAWTWDKFLADARALTKTADDGKTAHFGYGLWTGLRSSYGFFVWNAGGDILSSDGKACVIDRPEAIEGLQFMGDLITKHRMAPPMTIVKEEKGAAMWTTRRVVMHLNTNASTPNYRTSAAGFRWDVGVTPKGKVPRQTTGGGAGWAIATASPNREEAWPRAASPGSCGAATRGYSRAWAPWSAHESRRLRPGTRSKSVSKLKMSVSLSRCIRTTW